MSTSATSPGTAPSGTAAQNLPRNFDGLQYIASHGDLIQSLGADPAAGEQHYLLFGEADGRPTDTFNEEGYLDRYPDLEAAFGDDGDAATAHYIQFGFAEGRTAPPEELPPGFSGLQYIASYDDLVQTLGADEDAGGRHYLTYGEDEGRAADVFNEAEYFDRYPDLRAAFGGNADAAADHYIRFGFAENRSYNDPPVAEDDTDEIEEDGSPITVDVLANDTDPDLGDPGLTVASVDATDETNGTVSLNEAGEVVYDLAGQGQELAEEETTTDSFAYTVRDSAGATSTAMVTITVTGINDAPVAQDDGSDATDETNGTVSLNEDGEVVYDLGDNGQELGEGDTTTDSFEYTVRD
ncbi:MAG TPA: cadherin-like domain-containing protein, partial [Geminicoccaceae bacterium]|nr:cadherin-like domain-containing protein [Geminicoccaceae bacterium]